MGDTELYDTLGVSRHASDAEIRRAYHKMAKLYHPDKNPGEEGEEKFKQIQTAYEILSDPQKREVYDRFGMDAFTDGGGSSGFDHFDGFPGSMFGGHGDILSSFFDGGLFGGGHRRQRKQEPTVIPLEVTLEDLYNGATKPVEYKKKKLCSQCRGTGSKTGQSTTCKACRGSGIKVIHKPIGPNMVQQLRSSCSDCNGTGEFIRAKDRCSKCKAQRIFETETKVDVLVSPGMQHNQKIPHRGMGDEAPDMENGDLIVVLQEMDHTTFTRQGVDLFMKKEVSLVEALCGFTFVVDHLDGRKMAIHNDPKQVISPGRIRGLPGEGMPKFRHPELKGNLYVKFEVIFPNQFQADEEFVSELESLLPSKPPNPLGISDDAEEATLHDYEDTKGSGDFSDSAHDRDEDNDHAGHGVRCQQQ